MQENDDNSDAPTKAANNTMGSQSKVRERRIVIGVIVAALIGLLVCTSLLIQAFITHKPAIDLLMLGATFKQGFELLGYSSELLYITGSLALIIALSLSTLVGTKHKKLGYVSAFVGVVLLVLSFGLFCISQEPGYEWWRYFHRAVIVIAFATIIFSRLVGIKRRQLRKALELISYILLSIGLLVIVFGKFF